jgi:hypothetical protein
MATVADHGRFRLGSRHKCMIKLCSFKRVFSQKLDSSEVTRVALLRKVGKGWNCLADYELAATGLQGGKCTRLIGFHEPRETDNVSDKDGCQTALDRIFNQALALLSWPHNPPSQLKRYDSIGGAIFKLRHHPKRGSVSV